MAFRIGLVYDLKDDYLRAGFSPEAVMEGATFAIRLPSTSTSALLPEGNVAFFSSRDMEGF